MKKVITNTEEIENEFYKLQARINNQTTKEEKLQNIPLIRPKDEVIKELKELAEKNGYSINEAKLNLVQLKRVNNG